MPKETIHSPIEGVSTLHPKQYALKPRIPYKSLYVIGLSPTVNTREPVIGSLFVLY